MVLPLLALLGAYMVAPITGPFISYQQVEGPPNRYGYRPVWKDITRKWYRQAKPRVEPLGFSYVSSEVKWHLNPTEYTVEYQSIPSNPFMTANGYVDRVYRSAYANFLSKTRSSSAELLTLFCERREAASMIGNRAFRLAAGIVAIKNRDIRTLKEVWGVKSGWRENVRKNGGHVLEYSFGWAPLVSDIASAVETLRDGHFRSGKASQHSTFRDSRNYDHGALSSKMVWATDIGIRMGWELRVDHPSIALLNQLGLVNPVATAWELVPYSFVVDYFINVNDVINSMTALAGCSISRAWTTTRIIDKYSQLSRWDVPSPGYPPNTYGGERVSVTRVLGIQKPSLGVRAPWNMSWSRASTSVALLLQHFR